MSASLTGVSKTCCKIQGTGCQGAEPVSPKHLCIHKPCWTAQLPGLWFIETGASQCDLHSGFSHYEHPSQELLSSIISFGLMSSDLCDFPKKQSLLTSLSQQLQELRVKICCFFCWLFTVQDLLLWDRVSRWHCLQPQVGEQHAVGDIRVLRASTRTVVGGGGRVNVCVRVYVCMCVCTHACTCVFKSTGFQITAVVL